MFDAWRWMILHLPPIMLITSVLLEVTGPLTTWKETTEVWSFPSTLISPGTIFMYLGPCLSFFTAS